MNDNSFQISRFFILSTSLWKQKQYFWRGCLLACLPIPISILRVLIIITLNIYYKQIQSRLKSQIVLEYVEIGWNNNIWKNIFFFETKKVWQILFLQHYFSDFKALCGVGKTGNIPFPDGIRRAHVQSSRNCIGTQLWPRWPGYFSDLLP